MFSLWLANRREAFYIFVFDILHRKLSIISTLSVPRIACSWIGKWFPGNILILILGNILDFFIFWINLNCLELFLDGFAMFSIMQHG
jgi:hypothetical protein